MPTEEEITALVEAEIAALKAKIKAREKQPGFAQNVVDLKLRLATLEGFDAD